ncbi:hypothetical protein CCACVL1_28940 [Corchorus capsularis]|uniref:Eukaryotic translation initiation factor 3 subunit G n=1 Tax=Corchorus capsularis TaxID=210143 RepID=A0A1R3G4L5_COCAP|nr:hypothetical protein CCACVL1_28940 [Corchorus capsularis]
MDRDAGNHKNQLFWAEEVDDEVEVDDGENGDELKAGNPNQLCWVDEVDDEEYGDETEPGIYDVDDEEYGRDELKPFQNPFVNYRTVPTNTGNANKNKLCWADEVDDDGDELEVDLSSLLPPREIIGPDEKGIKKVIEYKFNEAGQKVKVTSTYRVTKTVTKEYKRVAERRSWAKFGDAVDEDVGSRLTVVSTEDVFLERPRVAGEEELELKAKTEEKKGGFLMVCRTCGKKGDHFTAKCPYKDLIGASSNNHDQRPSSSDGTVASSSKATGGGGGSTYVPPNQRQGAKLSGADMKRRNEENSIRVSNLSEDAQESDLRELFSPFGQITRVYVAPDRNTGLNRGFAFISFARKEDAEKAINMLDGYGYDSLILKVEWSQPRSK